MVAQTKTTWITTMLTKTITLHTKTSKKTTRFLQTNIPNPIIITHTNKNHPTLAMQTNNHLNKQTHTIIVHNKQATAKAYTTTVSPLQTTKSIIIIPTICLFCKASHSKLLKQNSFLMVEVRRQDNLLLCTLKKLKLCKKMNLTN